MKERESAKVIGVPAFPDAVADFVRGKGGRRLRRATRPIGLRLLGPALLPTAHLAGGVAIALTFRHRRSRDLAFFVPEDFDPERLAESLQAVLPASSFATTSTARGTLYLELAGVP